MTVTICFTIPETTCGCLDVCVLFLDLVAHCVACAMVVAVPADEILDIGADAERLD